MYTNFKYLSMVTTSLVLIGCGGGLSGDNNGGDHNPPPPTKANKNITIEKENQVDSLGKANSTHVTVNLGKSPKSLYILLSNYDKYQDASSPITHSNKIVSSSNNKKILASYAPEESQPKILHAPAYIQAFSSKMKTLLQKRSTSPYQAKNIALTPKSNKSVGDSETFYMDADSTTNQTKATLKKVVSNVSTEFGSKTLNVWVSDDSFGTGCSKAKCVTQSMVDKLADKFLKRGDDNDIYDWVTNIFGEEWGSNAANKYSNLIGTNDEITILLTDIGDDNKPSDGTIGYFYSKDNLTKATASGSNERIMFYADAVMFANNENDGFWQKEMYSTLAHEFQHMIHFYQKTVLLDAIDDIWINEMLSETTEDLVATKIHHTGPRGVDPDIGSAGESGNIKGRYPKFNENNAVSLTTWNNTMADYSKVSAFGTFLVRNYGGAKVLHDIMHNNKVHEDAIEKATDKNFNTLLKEWGVAVLLSDTENPGDKIVYNTGAFSAEQYKNSIYEMGSINFYNYDPQPIVKTTSGTVSSQGNYYYKVGDNLTGTVTIDLSLNGTTEATLIAK